MAQYVNRRKENLGSIDKNGRIVGTGMFVMYGIEICLILIVVYACVSAAVTDMKKSIISNKMIVHMLKLSIPLSFVYYTFFAKNLIPLYLINLLCTSVFAFFFYIYNLWAAGDSKLLFLIMTAIPARVYYKNPFGPFPGFLIILLTFALAFICIVIDSIYQGIREHNLFQWSVQLPQFRRLVLSYFFMVGSMTLINIILINLFGSFFLLSGLLITALDFIIVLSLVQIRQKISNKIMIISTIFIWSLIIFMQGSSVLNLVKSRLDLHAWMIVLIVMLLRLISEKYNYRKVSVDDLTPRMIPSAHTVMMFQMSRVRDLPTCMTEDLRARLNETQIDAIKRWKTSKYGKDFIVIVKKIPFAIYISIGTFLFILIEAFYFDNLF